MGYIYPKKVLLAYLEFWFLFARSGNPACYWWAVCPWVTGSVSLRSRFLICGVGMGLIQRHQWLSACRDLCVWMLPMWLQLGASDWAWVALVYEAGTGVYSLSELPPSFRVSECVCVFSWFSLICMECDPGTLMLLFSSIFCFFFFFFLISACFASHSQGAFLRGFTTIL